MDDAFALLLRLLADAEDEYARALQVRDKADAEVERRFTEVEGLRLAMERHGPPEKQGWAELPRTDAVIRLLQECPEPLGPSEIARLLKDRGRKDGPNAVAAVLSHLAHKDRVHSVGRARWAAGPAPASPGISPDAVPAVTARGIALAIRGTR